MNMVRRIYVSNFFSWFYKYLTIYFIQQCFSVIGLILLVFYASTPTTCQQHQPYVDKWEPFDIKNNPQVDKFESSLTQFGALNSGTIYEFAARPVKAKPR